eukprot:jgi/Mesen1/8712/ME000052S08134
MEGGEGDTRQGKPAILVTNDDGITAPGLRELVAALVKRNTYQVYVCAPDQERSGVAHSFTPRETLEVGTVDIPGTALSFEVSGTPVDCVSLALSGPLLQGVKPALVLSGINKGSNAGLHVHYSGTVGGAREAFMFGIPAIAFSLDWKFESEHSEDGDFAAAAEACMPIVEAALGSIAGASMPSSCFYSVDIPSKPAQAKGTKVTRQGSARIVPKWAVVTRRRSGAQMAGGPPHGGMPMVMGAQLAQLSLAASAAGAARRSALKPVGNREEVESTGGSSGAGAPPSKQHFRMELKSYEGGEEDEEVDHVALAQGWITVTPLTLKSEATPDALQATQAWVSGA